MAKRKFISKNAACLPGTTKRRKLKKVGYRCMCTTKTGANKFLKTDKCK